MNSRAGITSVAFSTCVGIVFLSLIPSLHLYLKAEANDVNFDAPGTGLTFLVIVAILVFLDVIAFGFGIAGILQRQRKRHFAILGIIVSVMVLALIYLQTIAWDLT